MPKEINITDKKEEVVEKEEFVKNVDVEVKEDSTKVESKESVKVEDKTSETSPTSKEDVKEVKDKKKKVKKERKGLSKGLKIVFFIVLPILLIGGIAGFYYFGIYKVKPYVKPSDIVNLNGEYHLSQAKENSFFRFLVSEPEEPRTEESPLNGLLFTKSEMDVLESRRPVAVMINNHAVARPQSGLNSADIVFESLVESGITRYMAIFWSEAPDKVGPIRSARQYYLEWLSPFDALYIHDGCAHSDDSRVNACGNIYSYGLKDISTIGAWRWNDGRRFAPHNEYSSVTNAWEYAEKMDWDSLGDVKSWSFKSDADTEDRGLRSKVEVVHHDQLTNSGYYDTVWTYDSKTNSYLKSTGNQPDIDQETDTQVYAKNVVIQEVEMTPTYDSKAHIIIDTIGQGDAIFLIDGKIVNGRWKKESRTSRTIYYDDDGNEVEFNRGRIWISAVARSTGKFVIIEQ